MNILPETNPGYLKLDLYCKGIKIDSSCNIEEDGRAILRTRAGLGSGLEMILPDNLYTNVPVEEHFVQYSPYTLHKEKGKYVIRHNGRFVCYVKLPKQPQFYTQRTSSGKLMSQIGVLQGTYLGIYPTKVCHYWELNPPMNCRFCSVGLNLGESDALEKSVEDVVETVIAARKEEKITFVHFNTGYLEDRELDELEPFIRAVKSATGLLIGVQTPPVKDLERYKWLKKLGVDHVSFCFEFWDENVLKEICPGKSTIVGLKRYLDAIEYCAKIFKPGAVSGEIIAGLEPISNTLAAIEWITDVGAWPTVCVFRPLKGTPLEHKEPPQTEELIPVFRRVYEACIEKNVPIGIAPNIKVSLVLLPQEGKYFVEHRSLIFRMKEAAFSALRVGFRTYFYSKMWLSNLKPS